MAARHKAEIEDSKVFCLQRAPIRDKNLYIKERAGEKVASPQDVDMEKNGKDFLEGESDYKNVYIKVH